jgi:hypothetical protein
MKKPKLPKIDTLALRQAFPPEVFIAYDGFTVDGYPNPGDTSGPSVFLSPSELGEEFMQDDMSGRPHAFIGVYGFLGVKELRIERTLKEFPVPLPSKKGKQ